MADGWDVADDAAREQAALPTVEITNRAATKDESDERMEERGKRDWDRTTSPEVVPQRAPPTREPVPLLTASLFLWQAAVAPITAPNQPDTVGVGRPSVVPAASSVDHRVSVVGPVLRPRFTDASPLAPSDTVFEYSKAYYRRLDVHRAASYTMIPLFALQVLAGNQLYNKGSDADGWAKVGHRVGATGIAALFTLNTVTGLQNLYEARPDPEGKGRRTLHAILMLAADAGFVATGVLSEKAEGSFDDRRMHRTVAFSSIGIATLGYLIQGGGFK